MTPKRVAGALFAGTTAAILLMTSPALAASDAHVTRVATCSTHGRHAVCAKAGKVTHPVSLFVHISSTPKQSVIGAWVVDCAKGNHTRSKHAEMTGRTPLRAQVTMPFKTPRSCVVSAAARLSHRGALRVWITARQS